MKTITFKDYSFTYVNENTKKGKQIIDRYINAKHRTIYDAYNKPSSNKINSYNKLVDKMKDLDGFTMKITGAGTDHYSLGYIIVIDNTFYLVYETACNSFIVKWIDQGEL